jgi:ABC-type oligopeptide transport system substrate-binding subunit
MKIAERADQILIEEAAVAPLYFEDWIWLLKNDVKNLSVGSMGVLELKSVYLDESKKMPDSAGDS